jgi:hypothetical protein
MYPDTQNPFSDMVGQFLAQRCQRRTDLQVSDRKLFSQFRAFWSSRAPQSAYPALLGQYRVELTKRGYRSHGGKRPHWYGLTLQIE